MYNNIELFVCSSINNVSASTTIVETTRRASNGYSVTWLCPDKEIVVIAGEQPIHNVLAAVILQNRTKVNIIHAPSVKVIQAFRIKN